MPELQRLQFAPDAPPHEAELDVVYSEFEVAAQHYTKEGTLDNAKQLGEALQQVLRNELDFLSASKGCGRISDAKRTRRTNCEGFTYAGSLLLERGGVPHVVGYTAGHAYFVLTGSTPYFVDSMHSDATGYLMGQPQTNAEGIWHIRVGDQLGEYATRKYNLQPGLISMLTHSHPWDNISVPVRTRLVDDRTMLVRRQDICRQILHGLIGPAEELLSASASLLTEQDPDIRFNSIWQALLSRAVTLTKEDTTDRSRNELKQIAHLADAYAVNFPAELQGFAKQAQGDILRMCGQAARHRATSFYIKALNSFSSIRPGSGGSYVGPKSRKVRQALNSAVRRPETVRPLEVVR